LITIIYGRSGIGTHLDWSALADEWLWRRGIQYVLVAPSTLKKFILGAGKGEKSFVVREVFKAYQLDATTDDEADACVLAHIGACLIGREEPRNKAQRDVLITLTAEKKTKKRKLKEAA
jgi:crossover junction endodeoxyribonuclease RuvC